MQAAGYCVFHLNSQTPLTTSVGSSGPVIVGLSPFGATKKYGTVCHRHRLSIQTYSRANKQQVEILKSILK